MKLFAPEKPTRAVLLLLITMASLVFLLLAFSPATARVSIIYESLGVDHFTMEVPDRWVVNVGKETDTSEFEDRGRLFPRIVTAMPDDGTPLWFGIWIPPDISTIEDARKYMAMLGGNMLDDVQVGQQRTETINGMKVVYVGGTGKKEDEPMDFYAAYIQLTTYTVVMALYIGPHETTVTRGNDLVQMINSLTPVAAEQEGRP